MAGKDIHLTLSRLDSGSATENRFKVKIWSDGPNEKDDGGSGDDVTIPPVEIDIPKWAMNGNGQIEYGGKAIPVEGTE